MASVFEARCGCGFHREVTIGGTRRSFLENSLFPFHCKSCGMVEVNVAKLPDDCTEVTCPQCAQEQAIQYGVPPTSLDDLRSPPKSKHLPWSQKFLQLPWLWRKPAQPHLKRQAPKITKSKARATLALVNRCAAAKGHICPDCHQMTLEFSDWPLLMVD